LPPRHKEPVATDTSQPTPGQTPIQELPPGLVNEFVIGVSERTRHEFIQTHISYLLMTVDRVYKIRKAVRFPFLSFATRAERNQDCLREVQLNRRLAPDVYLGVAPLLQDDGQWTLGEIGEELWPAGGHTAAPEHCVVMKRLRSGADAQSLLEKGELTGEHIDAIADRIAEFHQANRLSRPAPYSAEAWLSRTASPVIDTLDLIVRNAPEEALVRLASQLIPRCKDWIDQRRETLEQRRLDGRAVDGHGDLQLAHVWFDGPTLEPSIIDCTEFNEDFRRIDAASEVAFLAMDLTYRGHGELAERFLARYAGQSDDFGLYALVDYYAFYRAAVRAKVAVLAALETEISAPQREGAIGSAHAHLRLAERFIETHSEASITITCGSVGCGKSTVAREFAEALPAVVISSDRTRKRLAGLRDVDRSAAAGEPESGLYSSARTEEVYLAMLERAGPIVDSGRNVILDASFSRKSQRDAVRRWATARGIGAQLLEVRCSKDLAMERLAKRERSGHDPSDAGPSLYRWSVENFQPPTEWPRENVIEIVTDDSEWRDRLAGLQNSRPTP